MDVGLRIVDSLLQVVLPAACRLCAKPLHLQYGRPLNRHICSDCVELWSREAANPRWWLDGLPGASVVWYEAAVVPMLHLIKEGGHHGLVRSLARAWTTPPLKLMEGPLLVPVPAHPTRKRQRGGDHVEELCRQWAGTWGLAWRQLLRRQAGEAQRGLGAGRRRVNLAGQYTLNGKELPRDLPELLLVDDVITTGATLRCCRQVLEQAGGRVAGAISLACAPNPRLRREHLGQDTDGI